MKITPKFELVEGSFDTETNTMLCVSSEKYGEVELCFKEQDCGCNIPFAKIKLYSSGLRKDFESTFADAKRLGEEIARRWNNCCDKK